MQKVAESAGMPEASGSKIARGETYTGIVISARGKNVGSTFRPFLHIFADGGNGSNWYEPVYEEELSGNGFESFRTLNPIHFKQKLELSLHSFYDTINEVIDISSVLYWYQ